MGSKSIQKLVSKFDLGHQFGKKMGLPDPSGDLLYGSEKALSPAETQAKQAREMAQQQAAQAEQQMQMQINSANQAALQSAQQIQTSQDREVVTAQVAEAGKLQTAAPTVELAADIQPTQTTRKKFRGQVGAPAGGPSVRV